jgi:hypothetical protein
MAKEAKRPLLVFPSTWTAELSHLVAHVSALKTPPEESSAERVNTELLRGDRVPLAYLHARLDIIDNKISALLTMNGIFLATAALTVTNSASVSKSVFDLIAGLTGSGLMLLVIACWAYSTALCLRESLVIWQRLGGTSELDEYGRELLRVTLRRTANYNAATIALWLALGVVSVCVLATIGVPAKVEAFLTAAAVIVAALLLGALIGTVASLLRN